MLLGIKQEHSPAGEQKRKNDFLRSRKTASRIPHFRLPSEAEWEYSARGGLEYGKYPWGAPYTTNDRGCFLANFKPARGDYAVDGALYTMEAKSYDANGYGLYNMAGNVSEWTQTAYNEASYYLGSTMNPNVEDRRNQRKVIRGGSWKDMAYYLEVSSRDYEYSDSARSYIGFRTVQDYLGTSLSGKNKNLNKQLKPYLTKIYHTMAQSRASKKFFHMAYSIGASIVILGALFKILHMSLGPLNGDMLLMIGLFTEAGIFFISAFEHIEEDLDWSKVYPELAGGKREAKRKDMLQAKESQTMLSQKLDDMLRDAKLDAGLMASLGESIQNFKGAAEQIQPAVDSISATNRYSEQLSMAAAQMESLNSLYKVQLESTSRQAQVNEEMAHNADLLKSQMESMAANLQNLNGVYGGMLSAMNKG